MRPSTERIPTTRVGALPAPHDVGGVLANGTLFDSRGHTRRAADGASPARVEPIQRFARIVGRENVISSTRCGLGLRLHPSLAWAKLDALVQGARLATDARW